MFNMLTVEATALWYWGGGGGGDLITAPLLVLVKVLLFCLMEVLVVDKALGDTLLLTSTSAWERIGLLALAIDVVTGIEEAVVIGVFWTVGGVRIGLVTWLVFIALLGSFVPSFCNKFTSSGLDIVTGGCLPG